jgi:hypothetical protein
MFLRWFFTPRIFRPCGLDAILLCTELSRIDTVIGILPVTSCKAAASCIAFLKLERNFPAPILHLIADQLGLVTGMIAVTGPACLPARLAVYMQVMQVELAVAKIRIRSRVAFVRDFSRVARKAEGVLGGVVRRGIVGRIIGEKQLAVA